MNRALPLFLLAALPAWAQEPLSGAEFEAATTGKTIRFAVEGAYYGAEQYLPGREVRWSFLDGRCKAGRWYEQAEMICFVYEDSPEPACWRFFLDGGQLSAQFEGDADERVYATEDSDEPLYCMGPDLGV